MPWQIRQFNTFMMRLEFLNSQLYCLAAYFYWLINQFTKKSFHTIMQTKCIWNFAPLFISSFPRSNKIFASPAPLSLSMKNFRKSIESERETFKVSFSVSLIFSFCRRRVKYDFSLFLFLISKLWCLIGARTYI